MGTRSAGLLLFREAGGDIEVLLVHPGGPYWVRRDEGAWSIPKGEIAEEEDPLEAARREFAEETGAAAPAGDAVPLRPCRQRGGKVVQAWAVRGDFDPAALRSNTFTLEWPPRSGRRIEVPEVDRAAWFTLEAARTRILEGQEPLLRDLEELIRRGRGR